MLAGMKVRIAWLKPDGGCYMATISYRRKSWSATGDTAGEAIRNAVDFAISKGYVPA